MQHLGLLHGSVLVNRQWGSGITTSNLYTRVDLNINFNKNNFIGIAVDAGDARNIYSVSTRELTRIIISATNTNQSFLWICIGR